MELAPWQECARAPGRPSSRSLGKRPTSVSPGCSLQLSVQTAGCLWDPGDAFEFSEDTGCALGKSTSRGQLALSGMFLVAIALRGLLLTFMEQRPGWDKHPTMYQRCTTASQGSG